MGKPRNPLCLHEALYCCSACGKCPACCRCKLVVGEDGRSIPHLTSAASKEAAEVFRRLAKPPEEVVRNA